MPNSIYKYKGIDVAEGKGDGLSNNGEFFWWEVEIKLQRWVGDG